jgi:hypothetical protein
MPLGGIQLPKSVSLLLFSLFLSATLYAETQIGGGISWVQLPEDDTRTGYDARLMWFHEANVGFKVDFSRYDVGDFPEQTYTVFGGSLLYRFVLPKVVLPYAGAGVSSATISATPDEVSSADYSFTDATLNLVVGSQFSLGRILPYIEYQRLIYFDKSDFFGLNRANIYSLGVVFTF